MIKPLIMTGDFSMLPPLVAQTVSQRYGYHREAWFQNILINLTDYFSKIFGSDYQPLILTCTLAGAYEAIAANFLDNSSTVLLSVDSVFKKYAAIWGGENIIFDPHGENDDFSGSKARPTLAFLDAASASGRLLDLQQAAEKIKQLYPQCLIAADISTSFGADQCEFSATIDAYLISSEKALMGLPGLTLVIVKKAVLNQLSLTREKLLQRPFLLDLLKAYQIWESKKTTPYSPNISAAIALSAALKLIEQNGGFKAQLERHRQWAKFIRFYLTQRDFKILDDKKYTNAFTVAQVPKGLAAWELFNNLYQQGIIVRLKSAEENTLIIGHVGYLSLKSAEEFIKRFDFCLIGKLKLSPWAIPQDIKKFLYDDQEFFKEDALADQAIFSAPTAEFLDQAVKVADQSQPLVAKKIIKGAQAVFCSAGYAFKKRLIGLIGFADDIRQTIEYCAKAGFDNIIVYAPDLKKTDDYWQKNNINLADSTEDVLLKAHTIVLFPGLVLTKPLISKKWLKLIEKNGRLDVLINLTGGANLINQPALVAAVSQGWLKYFADDLPSADSPLLTCANAIFTGKIGSKEQIGEIALHFIMNSVEDKLLTPGPTRFNPEVFAVMDQYTYHTSPQFKKDFTELENKMKNWLGAHNPVLIHSVPSTGLMEAAVANLTKAASRGLVISHGKFGQRFIEICQAKKRPVAALKVEDNEWGKCFSVKEIKGFLKEDLLKNQAQQKISFICLQQNETSSGVAYRQKHLAKIAKIARQYNPEIIIIVDAVSGAFAHQLDFDRADIDCLIVGSQKGLGISSGLSFMALSDRALKRLLALADYSKNLTEFCREPLVDKYINSFNKQQKVSYLSLLELLVNFAKREFSAPQNIFHVYSALKSLILMEKIEGQKGVIRRHARLAKLTRKYFVKKLRASLLCQRAYCSNSVTVAKLPEAVDAVKLKQELRDYYGLLVGGAQSDYWKKSVIRVGHFGYVYEPDINHFLRAVSLLIKK